MDQSELVFIINVGWLSLKVAFAAIIAISPFAIFTGWFLERTEFRGKVILETAILMPMVIPPVATGLILLNLLSSHGPLGKLSAFLFDQPILLTWWAASIASATVAFPLFSRASQIAFSRVPRNLENLAKTLGKTPWTIFWRINLPLAKAGLIQGALLAFARAMGEFGATSLVAGNIPGQTETFALAIYSRIISGQDRLAWHLTLVAIALAYVVTLASELMARQKWGTTR